MVRHGFTLVEILVTLTVIAITAAVALPNLAPSNTQRLRREAQRIALAMENARDEAVYLGAPVGWRLEEKEKRILFFRPAGGDGWTFSAVGGMAAIDPVEGVTLEDVTMDGVKADPEKTAVFHPQGFATEFAITLALEDKTAIIRCGPLGRISVEAP